MPLAAVIYKVWRKWNTPRAMAYETERDSVDLLLCAQFYHHNAVMVSEVRRVQQGGRHKMEPATWAQPFGEHEISFSYIFICCFFFCFFLQCSMC